MKEDQGLRAIQKPCDLELRVRTPWGHGGEYLEYVLNSPSGAVQYSQETVRGPRLRAPDKFQQHMFRRLDFLSEDRDLEGGRLPPKEVAAEILTLGNDLYQEVFGREMRAVYRELRDQVSTLLITSDEPWIPWEILHPGEDGGDFFCMQFVMGRWLAGGPTPIGSKLVSRALVLSGGSPDELPGAGGELENLGSNFDAIPGLDSVLHASAEHDDVTELLSSGIWDLIHYAGHGHHDERHAAESHLSLPDRVFRAHHLAPEWAAQMRKVRPLVFFNACQVGRLEHSLTRLDGWAPRWLGRFHCGAYLASQWAVRDRKAKRFSEAFYGTLAGDSCLGQAVRNARAELRAQDPDSLDWLAYSLYGHPNTVVHLGHAKNPPFVAATSAEHHEDHRSRPGLEQMLVATSRKTSYEQHRRPTAATIRSVSARSKLEPAKPSRMLLLLGVVLVAALAGIVAWDLAHRAANPASPEHAASEQLSTEDAAEAGKTEQHSAEGTEDTTQRSDTAPDLTDAAGGPKPLSEQSTTQGLPKTTTPPVDGRDPEPTSPAKAEPSSPDPGFPVQATVEGRIGVVVLAEGQGEIDPTLTSAVEAAVYQALPGSNVVIVDSGSQLVSQLARSDLRNLPAEGGTPWGAQYLIVASATLQPLPQASPHIHSVKILMSSKLISLDPAEVLVAHSDTHTGTGAMQTTALAQATERCLRRVLDRLQEAGS